MKIYAVLIFTSLWLIHIRIANAGNSPAAYGNNFRTGGSKQGPGSPLRRAHHHHHNKPSHANGYRKKWYPHQTPVALNQRPRRPLPPSIHNTYMRQRLGLGLSPTIHQHQQPQVNLPIPSPTVSSHVVQSNFNLQQQASQQQQQAIATRNYPSKPNNNVNNNNIKWHIPTRNLKQNLPQAQPLKQHAPIQQKPFLSSPKIQTEIEYHIQNNLIPNNQPVMIKQLDDEKGPIHTIPAPNLGPADKPKTVHIHQPQQQIHYETTTTTTKNYNHKPSQSQSFQTHQYQVTESVDQQDKIPEEEIPPLQQEHSQDSELFSLLPLQDGYSFSVLHQPQLQQHLLQQQQSNNYQTMLVQPQFFQPEPTFLESTQHKQMATPPEMHTFNYEEPKHGHGHGQIVQSHVSAEYLLQQDENDQNNNEGFYTSLPSKEAADSFAQLQDAGRKQNDQVTGQSKQQDMMIYVPDDQEYDPAEDLEQYESSEGTGQGNENNGKPRFGFGSRIRPKK